MSMYNHAYHDVVQRAVRTVQNHQSQKNLKVKNTAHTLGVCIIILYVSNFMTFIDVVPTTTPTTLTTVDTNPASSVSIGVARNNREDRYHANNTRFSSFSYLIIGATSSKGNGGYEFEILNDK